ncbi:MAG TPA: S24 family peptidase [Thermoanaerobaculia bacterium]|jgi:hypothetical protein|nr:S24 family peptidase [Thermoanaerobaculia bacterium]
MANDPDTPPEDLPVVYGLILQGDSLEPDLMDGTCIVFSKTAQPERGDFVVAYFREGAEAPAACSKGVFRLGLALMPGLTFPFEGAPSSEVHPAVILETLNPRRAKDFRAGDILALHPAIGTAQPDGSGVVFFGEEEAT